MGMVQNGTFRRSRHNPSNNVYAHRIRLLFFSRCDESHDSRNELLFAGLWSGIDIQRRVLVHAWKEEIHGTDNGAEQLIQIRIASPLN